MINIKKFINNVRKEYPKQDLLENSFSSLRNMSDDARRNRAAGMTAFYQGIEQSSDGQARTMWMVPSQTDPSTKYRSTVEIVLPTDGGLFSIAKGRWDPRRFSNILSQADVRVSCTCPDFWWGGQTYNLGAKGKYKGNLASGANTTDLAPDVRDPNREHVLCKHLISVFNVFASNSFKIMSDARKYDANLETNPDATDEIEKGNAVLKKQQELFSIPDEGKKVITDALYKGAEELAKNQENEGAEKLIDERNETTEEITTEEPSPETGEMIDERNEVTEEESVDEPSPEVGEMIDEKNQSAVINVSDINDTEEIIEDKNETVETSMLEKDKTEEEGSEVSDDPNELLNRD